MSERRGGQGSLQIERLSLCTTDNKGRFKRGGWKVEGGRGISIYSAEGLTEPLLPLKLLLGWRTGGGTG